MSLQELIYTSVSSVHGDKAEVKNILAASELNNVANSVTGLLIFDGHRYIQILEGEAESVNHLYDVISKDSRHQELELLHVGGISARSFENWRMAYEALPPGLLADLAEKMAVISLEQNGEALTGEESFGARLNAMFIDAMAAA